MSTPGQIQYRYAKARKTRIRFDSRAFALVLRIVDAKTRQGLELAGVRPADLLRHCVRIVRNVIRRGRQQDVILLPFDGDVCRVVHGGYKIFNLRSMRVTKLFSSGISVEDREAEVSAIRAAGELSFAPNYLGAGDQCAWVAESLIVGRLGPASELARNGRFISNFEEIVFPICDELFRLRPLERITTRMRIAELNRQFDRTSFLDRFPEHKEFVDSVLSELDSSADVVLLSAFSHGDFGLVNIVNRGDAVFVIDWESAERRTILNDFFNALFVEYYYGRLTLGELGDCVDRFVGALANYLRDMSELVESISEHSRVYRQLYYLERLAFLLERQPSDATTRVINRSIRLFWSFETQCVAPAVLGEEALAPDAAQGAS